MAMHRETPSEYNKLMLLEMKVSHFLKKIIDIKHLNLVTLTQIFKTL